MITTGQGLRVSSSGSTYIQSGSAGGGIVRYNPGFSRLEVWDGSTWMGLATHHIDFDYQVVEILEWARSRMAEEQQLAELCEKYPSLKEAHERFEIVKQLVKKEHV